MKQQLTRFFTKTLILLAALILSDRIIGAGLERLFYKQTRGDDYTTIYALTRAHEEILIFGTSRASHHYNARIIEQKTGKSCFNAGRDDMEIPYTRALLGSILTRYKPEIIILDVVPMELSGDKKISYERIAATLMPFASKYPDFKAQIAKAGNMELLKMKASGIYAYNSKFGSMIQNSYTSLGHTSDKGYEPLYKSMDTAIYKESIWKDIGANYPPDTSYLHTLDSIIAMTQRNNIKLVVAISPFYFYNDLEHNNSYNAIKHAVAEHPQVTLLDFTNDPVFTGKPQLFNDDVHLNDSGAAIYTEKVIDRLRREGVWETEG